MRGRWQGSACLVPPCPGMLSQSQLLCPVPTPMSAQPWAVPTATLMGWLCHPPSSASGLVRAIRGVHGAELGLDITASELRPHCDGARGCPVPGPHGWAETQRCSSSLCCHAHKMVLG